MLEHMEDNPDKSPRATPRVANLLRVMSVEEKVAQLCCIRARDLIDDDGSFDSQKALTLLANGAGSCDPIRLPISEVIHFRNRVQEFLRKHTANRIPVIFHEEGCHGVLAPEATSFPAPIGLASSWDTELHERVFATVAAEMRSRGIHHALTPVVDINHEPRWGRTDETMGEDPFLNGVLGASIVRGLQGADLGGIGKDRVAATLKHFAGHGVPEAGVNRAPGHLGERELRERHLAPFKHIIATTKPATVMPSYNEVDGLPSHANKWLLYDVLRHELGFEGLVVADYHGVRELFKCHHVVNDDDEAALLAFDVGVEVDLPMGEHYTRLVQLVRDGKVSMAAIDRSVARVLELKNSLGLFEEPAADAITAKMLVESESARKLALEAAQKSIILLKNRNGLLPLDAVRFPKIALVGPHADDTRLGSYSGEPLHKNSILDGIRRKVAGAAEILHARGCRLTTNETDNPRWSWEKVRLQEFPSPEENAADIAHAVKIAQGCDLVVLVLGENELICRETWAQDHYGDRTSLDLFGAQNALADAMFSLGKPVIVYLMNGRPLAIPHIVERADALLEGWYMGQETGEAVADILFGDVNPSGKLTMTIPRHVGQVPFYYNHKPSARGIPNLDTHDSPLFPFGFGLSYTTFDYSNLCIVPERIRPEGNAEVSIKITNTGSRVGDEIVQLYIRDVAASVTRPVKELKGFKRITLDPGAFEMITFVITPEMLQFYGRDMRLLVELGDFEIFVGRSSAEGVTGLLHVVEQA